MSRFPIRRWAWLAGAAGLLLAGPCLASTDGVGTGPMAHKDAPAPHAADGPPPPGSGRVVLRCQVLADRTVGACQVAYEAPAGHGLGEAAQRMTRDIRIPSQSFRSDMVGAMVDIPLSFAIDADAGDMPTSPGR